jgi:hypothetical protein
MRLAMQHEAKAGPNSVDRFFRRLRRAAFLTAPAFRLGHGSHLPGKAAVFKVVLLALAFAAFLNFGFVHYPPIAPRDPDVAELVRQARIIGAAWRKFHDDPHFARDPASANKSGRTFKRWLIEIFKKPTADSPVTRNLTDKVWSDGSADLEPYLGALPIPPVTVVDVASGYLYWIPVWVNDVGFVAGPRGYAIAPEQWASGFLIRLDPANPDLCRAVAQASGQGNGIPHGVTGRGDWGRASELGAGEFTCVWIDNSKSGQLKPGNPAYLLFRVI